MSNREVIERAFRQWRYESLREGLFPDCYRPHDVVEAVLMAWHLAMNPRRYQRWRAYWQRQKKLRYGGKSPEDQPRAPKGGTTIGGKAYKGGEFIPKQGESRRGWGVHAFVAPERAAKDFYQAFARLHTARHRRFAQRFQEIDKNFQLHGRQYSAVGYWKGGAEDSFMTTYGKSQNTVQAVLAAAAQKALEREQLSFLLFDERPGGEDRLHEIELLLPAQPKRLVPLLDRLLEEEGLEGLTVVPDPDSGRVRIYTFEGETTGRGEEILQKRLPRIGPVRYSWRWFTGKGQFVGRWEEKEREQAYEEFREILKRYREDTLDFPFKYSRPYQALRDDVKIFLLM